MPRLLIVAVVCIAASFGAHAQERIDLARYLGFDAGVPALQMRVGDGSLASREIVDFTSGELGDDLEGGSFNEHLKSIVLQELQAGESAWMVRFMRPCPAGLDICEQREILILGQSELRYHGQYTQRYYDYVFQGYAWDGSYFTPELTLSSLVTKVGEVQSDYHVFRNYGLEWLPPGGGIANTVEAPVLIQAIDKGWIEAVPIRSELREGMVSTGLERLYFGHRLGLIQRTNSDGTEAYRLATLPPPVADGNVVEYVNTLDFPRDPGGHYFYTSDPAEQAWLDSGGAGRFVRTGRGFRTGGYVPVCRFYGSMSPGPNSHFFTADAGECAFLKGLQQDPVPQTVQQWNYEGKSFYTVLAVRAEDGSLSCMAGTVPVYRAYNNAYEDGRKNLWDSNHRYATERSAIVELVEQGWRDEGIAFCAPQ